MQKFNTLKSIPAYLPIVNIDTDMIIPKQFLKTIKRTGLGKNLFFEMRYDDNGKEINDFVLNQNPFNNSKILIAGKNFGCGSSREHAPWALLDFGITCVISSSFADIFYSNCFKNGILPIILDDDKIKELSEYAKRKEEISIDLNEEKIIYGNSEIKFKVDSFKKKCLLEGLDDIALSLKKSDKIKNFEKDLINKMLQSRYNLIDNQSEDIRKQAEELEAKAPDTVRFTRLIKDTVPFEDRKSVVKDLWSVVLSDGKRDAEENNSMRLIANLLGVNDKDSALARQSVERNNIA